MDYQKASALLDKTLRYSREREYRGYDKTDGLSSRILDILPVDSKWVNIAFQESAKRAPVNIRPLLLVDQRRNFKGTALFACANLTAWQATGEDRYRKDAIKLLDWLLENRSRGYSGFCGGHQHDVQTLERKIPAKSPGIVGTSYAVRALLRGAELDDKYIDVAKTATGYVFEDLAYEEIPAGARIRYKPDDAADYYTLNANALGARLLLDIHAEINDETCHEAARKILDYVSSQQTDIGGWMYRDPPEASHVSMDNYHNGFIIESLQRYQEVTGNPRYSNVLDDALSFYREILYEPDGAPNWDEENQYPKDTHAAAQGIVTFVNSGEKEFASRILDWTENHLHAANGQLYYQKERFYTKRFTLMRWCQGWMAYALSEYVRHVE